MRAAGGREATLDVNVTTTAAGLFTSLGFTVLCGRARFECDVPGRR